MTELILHELLCGIIFYGAFCRAVLLTGDTKPGMKFIVMMTGAVASLGMLAPIAWHYEPDWYSLTLLASSVTAQLIAAGNWREGVPHIFRGRA